MLFYELMQIQVRVHKVLPTATFAAVNFRNALKDVANEGHVSPGGLGDPRTKTMKHAIPLMSCFTIRMSG